MHKGSDKCQEFAHGSGHSGGQKSGQNFTKKHANLSSSDNNNSKKCTGNYAWESLWKSLVNLVIDPS